MGIELRSRRSAFDEDPGPPEHRPRLVLEVCDPEQPDPAARVPLPDELGEVVGEGSRVRRAYPGIPEQTFERLVRNARQPPPANPLNLYQVTPPESADLEEMLGRLKSSPWVNRAFRSSPPGLMRSGPPQAVVCPPPTDGPDHPCERRTPEPLLELLHDAPVRVRARSISRSGYVALEGQSDDGTYRRLSPEELEKIEGYLVPAEAGEVFLQPTWEQIAAPEQELVVPRLTAAPTEGSDQAYRLPQTTTWGVDSEFANTIPGGDGAGIGFIVVEQGWWLSTDDVVMHEDLLAANIRLRSGVCKAAFDHGVQTLGVIRAVPNGTGCVGIAPGSEGAVVSEYRRDGADVVFNRGEAVWDAVLALDPGDVLVLEGQTVLYAPAEIEFDVWLPIWWATHELGLIVVEPAGNGARDVSKYKDDFGTYGAYSWSDPKLDSDAIIVGAVDTKTQGRDTDSNLGDRLNCFAWGNNVHTTVATNLFDDSFGETSAATAIIAGCAIATQGMITGAGFAPVDSATMRQILSDPLWSTSSIEPKIGRMPDLRRIWLDLIQPQIGS